MTNFSMYNGFMTVKDITRGANDLARVLNTPVLSYLILCAGCRKVSVHYT
ncbi:hypothetical protein Tcan_11371 [Toxocara canis]|uniref:Uncharacterized protein n=1 Tax=Toxocara canis TaxID=6265 RepID=A0A0B2UT33_TOXCA|nr:hypothetical protein Tcan_11371 [Toxocara canis]